MAGGLGSGSQVDAVVRVATGCSTTWSSPSSTTQTSIISTGRAGALPSITPSRTYTWSLACATPRVVEIDECPKLSRTKRRSTCLSVMCDPAVCRSQWAEALTRTSACAAHSDPRARSRAPPGRTPPAGSGAARRVKAPLVLLTDDRRQQRACLPRQRGRHQPRVRR